MRVRQVMSRGVAHVSATDLVSGVQRFMVARGIRHVPVVDQGLLIGIFSDKDIPQFIKPQLFVADIMTINPVCVQADDSVDEARELIRRHRIGSLPVLEGRRLVGIVTIADLF